MPNLRDIVDGKTAIDLNATKDPKVMSPVSELFYKLALKEYKTSDGSYWGPREHVEVDSPGPREYRKLEKAGKII